MQPIIARPDPQGSGYEIVAGERRWRAAQKAALHTVPVIVRDLTDQEVAEFAVIENVQRDGPQPDRGGDRLQRADRAVRLHSGGGRRGDRQEPQPSHQHAAPAQAAGAVQALLQDGKLTSGHARALIGREDAETLARRIVEEDLTVRAVEALVQAEIAPAAAPNPGRPGGEDKDADTRAFEKDLSDALGLKVEIKPGSGESGIITIEYGNFEQLDYIKLRLIGPPER